MLVIDDFGKNHLKMKARDYGEFIIPAQTAKGFLLPLEVAEKLAVKIIETDKFDTHKGLMYN